MHLNQVKAISDISSEEMVLRNIPYRKKLKAKKQGIDIP